MNLVGWRTWQRIFECLGYRRCYLQSMSERGDTGWLLSADLVDSSEGIVTFRDESGTVEAKRL